MSYGASWKNSSLSVLFFSYVLLVPETRLTSPQDVPEFGVEVRAVAIQVYVTDKEGTAVTGLTAEDFRVTDEKRERPILALYEVDASAPVLDGAGPVIRATAPRQFLLLFDLSFSSPAGLVRSRDAARAFVKSLEPSDLASVATFSVHSGLKVLVGFTTDRRQLQSTIATLGLTDLDQVRDPLDLATFVDEPVQPQSEERVIEALVGLTEFEKRQVMDAFENVEKSHYWQKVEGFIDSLAYLGRVLDSVQGRKQIVLLSGGFHQSISTGRQLSQTGMDNTGRVGYYRSLRQFGDSDKLYDMDKMIESLTASDTIVHTVDVNGLESDLDAHLEGKNYQSGRESLTKIAHDTGGIIIKDTNDPASELGKVLDMSRKYYVLAFEPVEFKEPGRFHDLKVRLRKKGMNVSHRRGYWEPDPELERDARIQQVSAAEIISKRLTGGPIELRALAVPYRDEENRVTVSVMLEVDGKTLLDRHSGTNLNLEIYGYMFNERGAVVDFISLAPRVALETLEDIIHEKGLRLYTSFRGRPGRHDLRFLVRDTETGRSGAMATDVDVPEFVPGRIVLYPPLFMDDPSQGVIFREPSGFEPHPTIPYRVADEAFTPPGRPQLDKGRAHRVCVMFSDGGAQYDSGVKFKVKPQLLNSDGEAVRLTALQLVKAIMEPDGFRRFVLSFKIEEIPSGDYVFVVKLVDPSSGRVTEAQQDVWVN